MTQRIKSKLIILAGIVGLIIGSAQADYQPEMPEPDFEENKND